MAAKDNIIRGATRPCVLPCLTEWDCADITARTRPLPSHTNIFCGVGAKRRLIETILVNPADGSLTLRVTEDHWRNVIEPLGKYGCQTVLQRVNCDGSGEHYRMVGYSNIGSTGALTASGVEATDAVVTYDITASFRDMILWNRPEKAKPKLYITQHGRYYQAPTGVINGTNDTFILNPVPYDDPVFGRPVLVWLNDVLQVEGTDYTRVGGTIVFETPPPCPVGSLDGYLLVLWYTKEYLIYGKKPIAVWFCDNPSCGYEACGGACSDGCHYFHALFESDFLADPDACAGSTEEKYAIVATFSLVEDIIAFLDADVLKDSGVISPVDGLCGTTCDSLTSILAGKLNIWSGDNEDWVADDHSLPSGANFVRLAHSNHINQTYALFGNDGVMRRSDYGWVIVRQSTVGAVQQTVIDAAGNLVATAGGAVVHVSKDRGAKWTTVATPTGETALDIAIGIANEMSLDTGVLYLLTANATRTSVWLSEDYGKTWRLRESWAGTPVCHAQIEVAIDDWFLYVHIDGRTYRNTNYACKHCKSWELLAEDAPCDSILAVCHHNPDLSVVVGVKYGAVDDYFEVVNTGATLLDVLFNDLAIHPGCVIDPTSVLVTTAFSDAAASPELTGEIEITPAAAPLGLDFAQYTVEADCTDGTTRLYTASVIVNYVAP